MELALSMDSMHSFIAVKKIYSTHEQSENSDTKIR